MHYEQSMFNMRLGQSNDSPALEKSSVLCSHDATESVICTEDISKLHALLRRLGAKSSLGDRLNRIKHVEMCVSAATKSRPHSWHCQTSDMHNEMLEQLGTLTTHNSQGVRCHIDRFHCFHPIFHPMCRGHACILYRTLHKP